MKNIPVFKDICERLQSGKVDLVCINDDDILMAEVGFDFSEDGEFIPCARPGSVFDFSVAVEVEKDFVDLLNRVDSEFVLVLLDEDSLTLIDGLVAYTYKNANVLIGCKKEVASFYLTEVLLNVLADCQKKALLEFGEDYPMRVTVDDSVVRWTIAPGVNE